MTCVIEGLLNSFVPIMRALMWESFYKKENKWKQTFKKSETSLMPCFTLALKPKVGVIQSPKQGRMVHSHC